MRDKLILTMTLVFVYVSASYADYAESDLKNLFTNKSQRAKIDEVRFGKTAKVPVAKKINPKSTKVKVSGYVTRSDGESVVWLNGKSTLKSSKIGGVRVRKTGVTNKKVTINVDGKTVRLKPGETWSDTSGVLDPVK